MSDENQLPNDNYEDNNDVEDSIAIMAGTAHENRAVAASSSSPSTTEVAACFGFLLFCVIAPRAVPIDGRRRLIGFQELADGEKVWNLIFLEPQYPSTVPDAWLIVLGAIVPLGIQLIAIISHQRRRRASRRVSRSQQAETTATTAQSSATLHATLCTYFVALGITCLATGMIKNYCGYLRPSFYELCGAEDVNGECTNAHGEDARKSFPSGHASFSFCGLTLLALFLRQQYASGTSTSTTRLISIASMLFPMGLACFISASRIVDNRHFPADVVGGAVLGVGIANYVQGVWFPSR